MIASRDHRTAELEANLRGLREENGALHNAGRRHIDHLESTVADLRKAYSVLEAERR